MLVLKNISLTLSNRFKIQQLNISLEQGKHLAVIGESGCGKTTLLKLIYGLYDWDQGSITWGDIAVTGPKENLVPGMPFIKYLSQDFDLMPFISVEENVQKFLSRLYPKKSASRTQELLEVVEMTAFAKAHVKTLSGGQKQRVALAQTLAKEPQLLLLDEPFSHIDNFRKNNLRRKLFTYLKKQQITCIVATHDSTDVLSYMDETVVMNEGHIIAHKPTLELYNSTPSHYIASLFGEVNELPKSWLYSSTNKEELILVYPHQLQICLSGKAQVTVVASYFTGRDWLIQAHKEGTPIYFNSYKPLQKGYNCFIELIKP